MRAVMAKEVLIVAGRDAGATVTELGVLTGLDPSSVTRRCDAARIRSRRDSKFAYATDLATKQYQANIAKSQV